MDIICNWSSYNGSHCRRNIMAGGKCGKFCAMHQELISEYTFLKNSDELCETSEEIQSNSA